MSKQMMKKYFLTYSPSLLKALLHKITATY